MGDRRIATVGMFDGVHQGHQSLLSRLKELGDAAGLKPVVLTFERHPLAVISPEREPQYLMSYEERVAELSINGIDDVVKLPFDNDFRQFTAREFMIWLKENLSVDMLLMGFNHHFGSDKPCNFDQYRQIGNDVGIDVKLGDELQDAINQIAVSSTAIRRAITAGDVVTACRMLGRPYKISGEVVSGQQLGRKIGFPTANLRLFDSRRLIPGGGVYSATVTLPGGEVCKAVVNIGRRPTVAGSAESPVTIEAYIIDWQGDLYSQTITIEFINKIRDEKKFEFIDDLKTQIEKDVVWTLNQY